LADERRDERRQIGSFHRQIHDGAIFDGREHLIDDVHHAVRARDIRYGDLRVATERILDQYGLAIARHFQHRAVDRRHFDRFSVDEIGRQNLRGNDVIRQQTRIDGAREVAHGFVVGREHREGTFAGEHSVETVGDQCAIERG